MIKNILSKASNWLKEFGSRNVPKDKANVVTKEPVAKPKAAPKPPLKAYQKAQRHWDERLAASRKYVWISHRWVQFNAKLMTLKKKTLRILGKDGLVQAISVGRTFVAGRNAEKREARKFTTTNGFVVTPEDQLYAERRRRQLAV